MFPRSLSWLALALAACSGGLATKDSTTPPTDGGDDDDTTPTTETTTTGDDDDTTTTTTGDDDDDDDSGGAEQSGDTGGATGPPGAYFDPYYFVLGGQLTYDETTGTVASLGTAYGDIPPTVDLIFAHAQWANFGFDPAATDYYCVVSLDLTGGVDDPPWATSLPYVWYGIEYAGGPVYTDCTAAEGMEMDPAVWGTPQDIANAGPYGLATGDLSPEMTTWLNSYGYSQYVTDPYFLGGAIQASAFLGAVEPYAYGYAYAVDANLDIVYDNAGYLVQVDKATLRTSDTADTGGAALHSAWFVFYGLYIYVI